MHVSLSHSILPSSSKAKASTGQTPAHAPHPMQVSLSTYHMIEKELNNNNIDIRYKEVLDFYHVSF